MKTSSRNLRKPWIENKNMYAISQRLHSASFVGKFFRLPLKLLPRGMVVTVKSGLNQGCKWVVGAGTHSCWLGFYEHDKQRAIERLVRPGMVMFDVGANVGFYTLAFSRLVGEEGRVYAFEPDAGNVVRLRRHVSLNNLANITVVQTAVSVCTELVGFTSCGSGETGHIGGKDYLVSAISLDEVVASSTVSEPDFIKMDVEGAEAFVLEGARTLLSAGRAVWLIALHGEKPKRDCFRLLREYGYLIQDLEGHPVDESFRGDEIAVFPQSLVNRL